MAKTFRIQGPDGKIYTVQGETEAGAIAFLRQQQGNQPKPQPANPEGTGVGRAFQRGVIGTKQGIQAGIATNAANTLESMDVDRLTTIRRALGIVVPKDALAMMERDGTLQALGSVRNEDELNRWFDSLDRDFDLGPQNVAKLKAMVGGAEAAKSDYRAPGGKFETVRQTGQDALTRTSELEADRAALPMSPTAQRGAQDFQDAEGVRDWARKSFKDPMAALAFIGETAAETGPAMAAGIGTSVVTGNPLLGAGIMIAASTPREYGGEVMSFLRDQDINVSDPQAIREAIDNGNIMAEAQKRGLTKAAIISAFEAIGMKGGGGILLQGGKQAFTGGAGEAASQVALDGEITSAKEVALEAVAELATTPGEAAILYTKNGTLKDPSSLSDTESQAAASLAQRIRSIAEQDGYNLKDVGSNGDAKQALEATHEQISGQIKEIVANPAVKKYLNPKQAATLDQLIDDYAAAQVAVRQSKNKVKSKVTQENFDAIMRLLPPTVEAQQIANLMREGNQLTDLFKNGTKGGISQFTDTFNPFTREDGSYDPSKVISGMANKGVAIATMGGSLPYQFSAVGAGRAIDAVTGRRSAVNRFVNKYEGKETLPDPVGPSLIAAERLKKEQDDARAAELGGLPQVDKDNSPIGTILSGTGLDRDGLKAAMDEIQVVFPDVKALEDVFGDIRKNLDGGTNRIRNLNDIIPVINQHLNTPDTTVQRAAAPDQLLAQRGGVNIPNIDQTPAQNTPTPDVMSQAPQFGPQFTTQENYNRGIEANKAMNAELVEGVTTDPELNRVQKGRLITSLDVLANNLGSDPVAAAQEQVQKLEEAGVPQEAIDAYVKPYVDRVVGQQSRPRMAMAPQEDVPSVDSKKPQAPRLAPEQIPTQTRKVYKLMKVQKSRPGEVLPLFAKSGGDKGPASGYTLGEWFAAENQRPKLGNKLLAPRPGIHAVNLPVFDQGKAKVKGEQRVWVEVEIPAVSPETQAESDNSPVLSNGMRTGVQDRLIAPNESYDYKTNPNASNDAGGWPVAGSMKALRIVPDAEIAQILRDNGLDHQVANSFSDVDDAKAQQLMQPETPLRRAMLGDNLDGETDANPKPIGVAGVLANAIQGNTQKSRQPGFQRTNPPTTQEVKAQSPKAKAIISVGKEGTKWANGIREMKSAIEAAEAFDVTYTLYKNQKDLLRDNPDVSPSASGAYYDKSNRIVSLAAGASKPDGSPVSDFEAFTLFLHELSHAISARSTRDGSLTRDIYVDNPLTKIREIVPVNTFEALVGDSLNQSTSESRKILAELMFIQDNVGLAPDGAFINRGIFEAPGVDRVPMRKLKYYTEAYNMLKRQLFREGGGGVKGDIAMDLAKRARDLKDLENYQRSIAELTVDAKILYNFDPKFMKRIAPTTAAKMAKLYKDAGSSKFQLYTNPFALALAIILASLIKAEQEDEQEKQIPPGALNQPMMPGALSA